jgi:OmpA family
MNRAITACLAGCLVGLAGARAAAEPLELGGWLGPRIFSDNSSLGQRDVSSPGQLTSALELGGRVGLPLYDGQLIPEAELALSFTQTDPFGVDVFWMAPRLSLRYQFNPERWLRPFVFAGGGVPIALSNNTDVFSNHVLGEGFVGGGVSLATGKGFALRVDARLSFLPGEDPPVAVEAEIGVGVTIPLGGGRDASRGTVQVAAADRDKDGVEDAKDACPDRPEDLDQVEDGDGCPDIDNDLDRVLDIADACPLQPEVYNGVEDDDGCPDSVPPEVAAIVGVIGGLVYAPNAVSPSSSGAATAAFDRISQVILANPTLRIRLVGHTDDKEAHGGELELELEDAPATTVDPATLAVDLGYARATAIRELLISRGIAGDRITPDSRGFEEPVGDNNTAKGQLSNRRVELLLLVPQR